VSASSLRSNANAFATQLEKVAQAQGALWQTRSGDKGFQKIVEGVAFVASMAYFRVRCDEYRCGDLAAQQANELEDRIFPAFRYRRNTISGSC